MKGGAWSNFGDPYWFITTPMSVIGWIIALVGSILNNSDDSSRFPVFSWWGLAFEAVVIILTAFAVWSNRIRQYRFALLSMLSVATVYTTNSTNNFVWRDNVTSGATAAGNILLSTINFFWILYLGTSHDEPVHSYVESFSIPKKPTRNPRSRSLPDTVSRQQMTSFAPYSEMPVVNATSTPQRMEPSQIYSVDQLQRHGLSYDGSLVRLHPVTETRHRSLTRSSHASTVPEVEQEEFLHHLSPSDTDLSLDEAFGEYQWRARAKFSYQASLHDGEINFQRGEILQVKDMRNKWWLCRRANGEVGIAPNNYLELLDEPTVATSP